MPHLLLRLVLVSLSHDKTGALTIFVHEILYPVVTPVLCFIPSNKLKSNYNCISSISALSHVIKLLLWKCRKSCSVFHFLTLHCWSQREGVHLSNQRTGQKRSWCWRQLQVCPYDSRSSCLHQTSSQGLESPAVTPLFFLAALCQDVAGRCFRCFPVLLALFGRFYPTIPTKGFRKRPRRQKKVAVS